MDGYAKQGKFTKGSTFSFAWIALISPPPPFTFPPPPLKAAHFIDGSRQHQQLALTSARLPATAPAPGQKGACGCVRCRPALVAGYAQACLGRAVHMCATRRQLFCWPLVDICLGAWEKPCVPVPYHGQHGGFTYPPPLCPSNCWNARVIPEGDDHCQFMVKQHLCPLNTRRWFRQFSHRGFWRCIFQLVCYVCCLIPWFWDARCSYFVSRKLVWA